MKTFVRNLCAVAAATTLAVVATACGSSSAGESDDSIVIATVGAATGPIAYALSQQQVGLDAWVRHTNDNGGIEGKKIVLKSEDSKSDATTETTAFQRLAQSENPVAFVGAGAFNPLGAEAFLKGKGIPVIGGQTADSIFETSPVFFNQGASSVVSNYGIVASAQGKNLGIVYCSDTAQCAQNFELMNEDAEMLNTPLVFSQKMSYASAADFTATCLAAKDAGVEYLTSLVGQVLTYQMAEQCAQQGFAPKFIFQQLGADAVTPTKPGIEGALVVQTNLPVENNEAGAEFRAAMEKYYPDSVLDPTTMQGWASGVLFGEAAASTLKNGDKVTSEALIEALETMPETDLGGLAPGPISFGTDVPRDLHTCWFSSVAEGGKWVQQEGLNCVAEEHRAALEEQLKDN